MSLGSVKMLQKGSSALFCAQLQWCTFSCELGSCDDVAVLKDDSLREKASGKETSKSARSEGMILKVLVS